MEFRRRRKIQVRLDISALIDVVFLLLIFFAISTTFLDTSGIPLELPESTGRAERDPEDLTIAVAADGRVEFRGRTVTVADLEPLLATALDETASRQVTIRADANALHGRVVELMDIARRAGADGLTVATREPAGGGGG